jgi:hypothetical protein
MSAIDRVQRIAPRQLAALETRRRTRGAHYAAAAQYRRGQVLGGNEGRVLLRQATTFFAEQNVVNAERITNLLAPGAWQPADKWRSWKLTTFHLLCSLNFPLCTSR